MVVLKLLWSVDHFGGAEDLMDSPTRVTKIALQERMEEIATVPQIHLRPYKEHCSDNPGSNHSSSQRSVCPFSLPAVKSRQLAGTACNVLPAV